MLTNKDYCDYDTCVALIKLGYNRKSNQFYIEKKDPKVRRLLNWGMLSAKDFIEEHGWLLAINLYEAQKFLREEKDVIIVVCPYTYNVIDETHTWTCEIWFGDNLEYEIHDFKSYEEALSEGIKEAVKILKN